MVSFPFSAERGWPWPSRFPGSFLVAEMLYLEMKKLNSHKNDRPLKEIVSFLETVLFQLTDRGPFSRCSFKVFAVSSGSLSSALSLIEARSRAARNPWTSLFSLYSDRSAL